jgi:DNA-binding NtrC family response regulator
LSPRKGRPLIIASCMEIPPSLIQSELFGHTEGAFTGATRERIGLIESASGGTFFLDEIGEMPLPLQASLLRVLQEKEVRRIGESRRRTVDVRFLFATNRNLLDLVKKGRFRKDLFFRIHGIGLSIPPLRRRREDIVLLARHFLRQCASEEGIRAPDLSFEAARRLVLYDWPGNVRELKNEVERLIALYRAERIIGPQMLSPHVAEETSEGICDRSSGAGTMPAAVQELECRMIRSALDRFGGNRTKASEALGITRQGLLKKLKRYGASMMPSQHQKSRGLP